MTMRNGYTAITSCTQSPRIVPDQWDSKAAHTICLCFAVCVTEVLEVSQMRAGLAIVFVLAAVVPSPAQDRPFMFSITTVEESKPAVRFDYDVGIGESAFQSDVSNQPEQRLGLHASYRRLTMLARFGIAEVGSSYQSSQSGEILYSM